MVCSGVADQCHRLCPATMSELEFIFMAIEKWPILVGLSMISALILFTAVRSVIVGGLFDPLVLALVVGYSVNYAIVAFLWLMGESKFLLTALVFGYGIVMLVIFRRVSRQKSTSGVLHLICRLTPPRIGLLVYWTSLSVYFLLAVIILGSIGFGVFAENNRFEAARGFGGLIRVLDFLGPFIISYSTVSIFTNRRHFVFKLLVLAIFILFAAMVNGAKISVIFSLVTVFFTLSVIGARVRIRPMVAVAGLVAGLAFSLIALSINLKSNNVEEGIVEPRLSGVGLVVERLAVRILASGDTSYLLLPNDVIDKIERDNALTRFLVPFIGITTANQVLGYPVGDYSVGRQALLYYDSNNEIAGGPTSHFDLFGYVYFGPVGGFLFAAVVGAILGSINRAVRVYCQSAALVVPNHFRVALLATLWTRAVLLIIEPTVALAYIVEVLLFFAFVSVVLQTLPRFHACRELGAPISGDRKSVV